MSDAKALTDEEREQLRDWAEAFGHSSHENIAFTRHEGELIERYEATLDARDAEIERLRELLESHPLGLEPTFECQGLHGTAEGCTCWRCRARAALADGND